jgi:hypothetical protein
MNRLELAVCLSLVTVCALVLTGCSPHIGAKCTLNTDCSLQGTLVCDTSEPDGYCTLFNCLPDSCQNKAACVMLSPSIPGCPYDDYQSPARTGRTMCLEQCHKDSDCRTSDGYICADPQQPPWNGIIVDDDQQQRVCIVAPDYYDAGTPASFADAAVCQSTGPVVPPIEAGGTPGSDAEVPAGDGGPDAASDAALDAGAGTDLDGTIDAAQDAGIDAAADAPSDAGPDAAEGGE